MADSPQVILTLLSNRGVLLEGLPEEKLARRVRLAARMNYISERQADALRAYFGI